MRHPRILDVVAAVRRVAPSHRDVHAWWYAPPRRLHVDGAKAASAHDSIEVVIEQPALAGSGTPRPTPTIDPGYSESSVTVTVPDRGWMNSRADDPFTDKVLENVSVLLGVGFVMLELLLQPAAKSASSLRC